MHNVNSTGMENTPQSNTEEVSSDQNQNQTGTSHDQIETKVQHPKAETETPYHIERAGNGSTENSRSTTLSHESTDSNTNTNTKTDSETPFESENTAKIVEKTINAVNSQVTHLVEWENNVHSGTALAAILSFLIFTAYNSLFNTFCFLAIAVIGIDWLYVLGNKQFKTLFNQKPDNPHEQYLRNPPRISRKSVDKYVDVWVDIINKALEEGTKIVFVEDPLRSVKYVIAFYLTWTVASWFSFRTITALVVITAFTVPKLYKQNKKEVDQHLGQAQKFARDQFESGYAVVNKHAGGIIGQVQTFAASKGIGTSDNKKE